MTIPHPTPTQSAPAYPTALVMAAERQPSRPLPETGRPAIDNAATEDSAVAVLGYN